MVELLGGKFPEVASELEHIPGVGRYTAGAIASIAFNQVKTTEYVFHQGGSLCFQCSDPDQ